jgi:hypothetical protein
VRRRIAVQTRIASVSTGASSGTDLRWLDRPAGANLALAYAQLTFRGNRILGARLVFGETKYIVGNRGAASRNTLLHEVGHALGLGHSASSDDVMSNEWPRRIEPVFGAGESISLRMMYRYRAAGNGPPDRAPGVFTAAGGMQTVVVVD